MRASCNGKYKRNAQNIAVGTHGGHKTVSVPAERSVGTVIVWAAAIGRKKQNGLEVVQGDEGGAIKFFIDVGHLLK